MRTVWKFPVPLDDSFDIEMPAGSEILCVQTQRGEPCIWAEVSTEAERKPRSFRLFGTGHSQDIDAWVEYVGTFQVKEGDLVFHIYEVDRFDNEIPF